MSVMKQTLTVITVCMCHGRGFQIWKSKANAKVPFTSGTGMSFEVGGQFWKMAIVNFFHIIFLSISALPSVFCTTNIRKCSPSSQKDIPENESSFFLQRSGLLLSGKKGQTQQGSCYAVIANQLINQTDQSFFVCLLVDNNRLGSKFIITEKQNKNKVGLQAKTGLQTAIKWSCFAIIFWDCTSRFYYTCDL